MFFYLQFAIDETLNSKVSKLHRLICSQKSYKNAKILPAKLDYKIHFKNTLKTKQNILIHAIRIKKSNHLEIQHLEKFKKKVPQVSQKYNRK